MTDDQGAVTGTFTTSPVVTDDTQLVVQVGITGATAGDTVQLFDATAGNLAAAVTLCLTSPFTS